MSKLHWHLVLKTKDPESTFIKQTPFFSLPEAEREAERYVDSAPPWLLEVRVYRWEKDDPCQHCTNKDTP